MLLRWTNFCIGSIVTMLLSVNWLATASPAPAADYNICEGLNIKYGYTCQNTQLCRVTTTCYGDISHVCEDGSCGGAGVACQYSQYTASLHYGDCSATYNLDNTCTHCNKWYCAQGTKYKTKSQAGECQNPACNVLWSIESRCAG